MTRMPISYGAYHQGWQPNLFARIENIGETDVANPWLTVNGLGDWRTVQKIAEEATRGCRSHAEKARALWEWERHHRFHATTWDAEASDAVKAHNVYGYTLCGDDACVLADLWRAAGLQVRAGHPVGHCVVEALYNGGWHLLDGDEHVICLLRDNRTIASEADVVRDHDLMKRTHTYSIGAAENPLTDQFSASLYGYEGERKPGFRNSTHHTMLFTLRPGESLEWRWDHAGKEYSAGTDIVQGKWSRDGEGQLRSGWGDTAYDNLRNGKWLYRPPLDKPLYRRGIAAEENVACAAEDALKPNLHPKEAGQPAKVVWKIASPYVIVGATIKCQFQSTAEADLFRLSWSSDGKAWSSVFEKTRSDKPTVAQEGVANIDKLLSPRRKPMYAYFVQVEMNGAARGSVGLDAILFDTDVQMSLLGMPELAVGENRLCYTDDSAETKDRLKAELQTRRVRITHAWLERTAWQPPRPPETALSPQDGATVEGTRFAFKWSPAVADQGAAIADYHIQVCDREDMRWVISSNFDKLTSLTPSRGKPEWAIPFSGLLNPDTPYYWRVRAKDNRGVWGQWSRRFAFRCAAPGVPLNVRSTPDPEKGSVDLTWDDNPQGRKPVRYKVYGSDEKGFTASDSEHVVRMGHGFCDTMEEFKSRKQGAPIASNGLPFFGDVKTPANLIAETKERRLSVHANRAYYRVVAVDEKGNESGPSDYAEFPRPFIYTKPPAAAKVGQPWRYEPAATASIGHLTCKDGYNPAFWGREKLTWTLESGPAWLKLEGSCLAGTPAEADAGSHAVSLRVSNNKGGQAQQKFVAVVAR
ncbi:MAG: hypothetical protein FJ291_21100 [Planctomycetes bacterium]|nr:hypothetical protein [Planctomycetota bacterium]